MYEDLSNFVTFRHYGLITEKNCVLVAVQAEVEERDDDLKLTIVNGPLLLSAFTTYGRLQVFDYDRLQSVSKKNYYAMLFAMWKGAFKLLAFPVFLLYLLINLTSRDNNRTRVSEVLPSLDTLLGLT